VIEESNVIQLIENFFDHDDFMGSFKFVPDERAMLGSNLSMSFRDQVRKRNDLSHVYDIHVDVSAQLVPGSEEIARTGSVLSDVIADRGEFVTSGQLLCIGNGTRVPWTRHDLKEQWDFAFNYPFAEAVWSIDGMDLPPGRDDGTLDFAKTVRRARTMFRSPARSSSSAPNNGPSEFNTRASASMAWSTSSCPIAPKKRNTP
jgi:hypothetical protein